METTNITSSLVHLGGILPVNVATVIAVRFLFFKG